ncbi:hypothetical protein RZS28_01585 [Methylocapsa polymorpha]|uniref:Uncharacterized protein n=1 Tax=Methylocapsa polymorpha TaxID=3080828 RepID=A0ABZ0HVV8_9HYPH|nr:hypothetical protein RZS28_01585 [Methylocapsa sp. RX1]
MPPCFFFFCMMIAPTPGIVPDGAGGYVPITNSRVLPDGSLRPYYPPIDGPYFGEATEILIDPPVEPLPDYWVEPVVPPVMRR